MTTENETKERVKKILSMLDKKKNPFKVFSRKMGVRGLVLEARQKVIQLHLEWVIVLDGKPFLKKDFIKELMVSQELLERVEEILRWTNLSFTDTERRFGFEVYYSA